MNKQDFYFLVLLGLEICASIVFFVSISSVDFLVFCNNSVSVIVCFKFANNIYKNIGSPFRATADTSFDCRRLFIVNLRMLACL